MASPGAIAVIGGTGVEDLAGMERVGECRPETPYGSPSGAIRAGRLADARVLFLQRHGSPLAAIPPHRVNYRANLWSLRSLGATAVLAINAVGGITPAMRPGRLVIPDQVIDYTWGREHTFDEGADGSLMHVDFTEPYDRGMRRGLIEAAASLGIPHEPTGVYAATQGPRLESAAEIRRMARDGCDVVGMTGMPEAALARELGLPYASICMVVNPAAGLGDTPLSLAMMREILAREAAVVRQLLGEFIHRHEG